MSLKNECIGKERKAIKKKSKQLRRRILYTLQKKKKNGYIESIDFHLVSIDFKNTFDYFWMGQNPKEVYRMIHEYA